MSINKIQITLWVLLFNCHSIFAKENTKPVFLPLSINGNLINAELAINAQQREQGLMDRENLSENQGMLFVFPYPTKICMWMKNTKIPLAVAFFGKDGKIINIEEMEANTLTSHCSTIPVEYALEMNYGWFAKRTISSDSKVNGLLK